ncbi:MAG: hypothetical protein ACRD3V_16490 [Vicinamibacteria bacterium]
MGRLSDEDLGRLLRELPAAPSSTDFTERVLEKLDSRSRSGGVSGGMKNRTAALATAAALVLGIVISQGYLRERYEKSQTAERVRELRGEYRELQAELEKLRALTRELEPVLDLGGTEDVGFVFDLRGLAREPESKRTDPVSHSPSHPREGEP